MELSSARRTVPTPLPLPALAISSTFWLTAAGAVVQRSGYVLTKWLQMVGQHCWAVEHSSVYPALRELEGEDLIVSERLPGTRGAALTEQAYIAWCDEVAEMLARRPA